jgi:ATP-dependent DNA helicase RecG
MKEQLEREVFVEHRIGLVHGRMKAAEKEAVMKAFKARELDILVATTVIEVGVDVPGATVMVIEHAERFGLAQLHQLRGRVGRGTRRAICLLMAEWTGSEDAYKRLKIMEETTDGFRIAEEDLKLRGPGDFIGTRQSGLPDFRLKETLSDLTILKAAREEALEFFKSDARLESLEARVALAVLKSRWTQRLELAEVG